MPFRILLKYLKHHIWVKSKPLTFLNLIYYQICPVKSERDDINYSLSVRVDEEVLWLKTELSFLMLCLDWQSRTVQTLSSMIYWPIAVIYYCLIETSDPPAAPSFTSHCSHSVFDISIFPLFLLNVVWIPFFCSHLSLPSIPRLHFNAFIAM